MFASSSFFLKASNFSLALVSSPTASWYSKMYLEQSKLDNTLLKRNARIVKIK